eukprot:1464313-Rhodomonas_salina.1
MQPDYLLAVSEVRCTLSDREVLMPKILWPLPLLSQPVVCRLVPVTEGREGGWEARAEGASVGVMDGRHHGLDHALLRPIGTPTLHIIVASSVHIFKLLSQESSTATQG